MKMRNIYIIPNICKSGFDLLKNSILMDKTKISQALTNNRLKLNCGFKVILSLAFLLGMAACDNVDEGYRIDYGESSAQFAVELLTADRGSVGDTIIYNIQAVSEFEIKSLLVGTTISGESGSGFVIPTGETDPLIDHVYGTIQPGTKAINIQYNYVVSQDTVDATVNFTMIDEMGKKEKVFELLTIPSVVAYDSLVLYSKTSSLTDGLSTADGVVYHNLTEYEEVNVVNNAVQEALDIVFIVNNDVAMLVAPYNGTFSSGMSVKNKTLFKKIANVTSTDFDNLTDATLSIITEENEVKKGSTSVGNLKVGDIIGFRTDLASTNPYHFGLIRINAIHPTNVEYYEGVSYMIEMDVVTQKIIKL